MPSKGEVTRQRILEATLQLFSVKGYFGTSIHDVMEEVGITKGGLYGHFRSKEELWNNAYEEAVLIWRGIVFRDASAIDDPVERICKVVEHDLLDYVGEGVFAGGCFFLNCLLDVSGRSDAMTRRILKGFVRFSKLLASWLEEAKERGLISEEVDSREVADFIIINLNGATALYTASRDRRLLETSVSQTRTFLEALKR